MYDYTWSEWLLIFYIYCFMGWIFECIVVTICQKKLVNRGFLRGPMLPIYGFGASIMLHVSLPLVGHPVKIYFAGMVVATVFEYVVGVLMEAIFKIKYWDYSEHRFQFQGRICLQSSLAWGALSVLLTYAFHPPVEYLIEQFTFASLVFTVVLLSVYFLTDVVASAKIALDIAKLLEDVDEMRANVSEMRNQFTAVAEEKRAELTAAAQETKEAITDSARDSRERLVDAAHEGRERLNASAESARLQAMLAIAEAEDQISEKIKTMKRSRKGLLRGNPTLRSEQFNDTLREIKDRLRHTK